MTENRLLSINNPLLDKLILRKKQDNLSTEIDDETVILDMASGLYIGLDSVGTSIWKSLEQEICYGELCKNLIKEFDVDKQTCRDDTLLFLQELKKNKLITIK